MKRTKLMDRVFSAIENNEEEVTKQIDNDLQITMEDGELDTDQYCMKKLSDTEVEIHDKVNDEDTIAKVDDEKVELTAKECNTKTFDFDYKKKANEIRKKMQELKDQYEKDKAELQAKFDELKDPEKMKQFSDSLWYIVSGGKIIFTGTQNECRSEWMKNGYKLPEFMVTPVAPEEVKPETRKKTFSMKSKRTFSDANPTPNQEGADYELKQWIEEHPDWTKYIAELGAKWGADKVLEGLEHDMNE